MQAAAMVRQISEAPGARPDLDDSLGWGGGCGGAVLQTHLHWGHIQLGHGILHQNQDRLLGEVPGSARTADSL